MPWIIEEVEEKLNKVYQGKPLESIEIEGLECKSFIANQFFDFIVSLDLADNGLKKLIIKNTRL